MIATNYAGTLYAFLNVAAGLIFYRLYDPKKSTKHNLVKVLAHLITICAASVGELKTAATPL